MSVEVCEVGKLRVAGMWKTSLMMSLARKCHSRFSKHQGSGLCCWAALSSLYLQRPLHPSCPNVAAFEIISLDAKSEINLCAAWLKGRGSKTPATRSGSRRNFGEPSLPSLVSACWAEQKNRKEMQLPRVSKQEVSDLLPPCLRINWWLPIKIFSL